MCSACEGRSDNEKPFHVCILTVSDTAAANASTDKSGPVLKTLLDAHQHFTVLETAIVPDVLPDIRAQVQRWTSRSDVQLVLTTGGTGFAPNDVTPEAVAPLITREAPGLSHVMLASSLKITPMAALARPICGTTANNCIIVTLPGSSKGAKENLEAILPILPHALKLANGQRSRELHANGAPAPEPVPSTSSAESGHSHHHHHHHHGHHHGHAEPKSRSFKTHDPSKGASTRNRSSPYPIISMDEAFEHIFSAALPPIIETRSITESGASLRNHILAEDIHSDRMIPYTHTTNVDGYAVHSEDGEGVYPVWTSESHPIPLSKPLPKGIIYRVNTGGPIPEGADAVVMVEDTEVVSTVAKDGRDEEKEVKILVKVDKGENVRKPGSDVGKGDMVLAKDTLLSDYGGELGTLHFVGRKEVKVYRRPVIALLSTGNELVNISDPSTSTSIFDTNRPALHTILSSAGYEVIDLGIARDNVQDVTQALRKGIEQADVIIATGGTSMGEVDLLKPVIEREMNGTIHFGRVAMKPGKPTTLATVPLPQPTSTGRKSSLIFSLPGNPASALVTYNLFVLPCLRKMSGHPSTSWHLPRVKVSLSESLRMDQKRPEFHRVHVKPIPEAPYLIAVSTGGQRSSKADSMARANGLICLPAGEKAEGFEAKKGDLVDCILLGSL